MKYDYNILFKFKYERKMYIGWRYTYNRYIFFNNEYVLFGIKKWMIIHPNLL